MIISRKEHEALCDELRSYKVLARNAIESEKAVLNSNAALYEQNRKLQREVEKYKKIAYAEDEARRRKGHNMVFNELPVIREDGGFEILKAHANDAGYDIRTPEAFTIKHDESKVVKMKIRIKIPEGYEALVESKSGLMCRHFIVVMGGEIDADYTGEIAVALHNFGADYQFNAGDKIAQLVFRKFENPVIKYVDSFEETERGENGFGSSGR